MTPGALDTELTRHDDLLIPVGDETIAATRFEPRTESDPLPVILMATPYRKDERVVSPDFRFFAANGYEVVVMDLLGLGGSSGTKVRSYDEGDEVATAIEWLADQDWTDGTVGMYGISYQAFTQLEAAERSPDALRAIVPVAISDSEYGRVYPGGAFDAARRTGWATMMHAQRALPPSWRDPDGRWRTVWRDRLDDLRGGEPWLFQYLGRDTMDEFWEVSEIDGAAIAVPTLAVCGYRDYYVRSMLEYFREIDAPKRFLLGPWDHVYPHQGAVAPVDFRRQALEWYDRFLKGEDNGALEHPTITYWTEWERAPGDGPGVWRGRESWPGIGHGASELSYAVAPDGLVPTAAFSDGEVAREYPYDPTVGATWIARGPVRRPDVRADDARAACFETEPLPAAVELTGTPELTLRLQATTPDPIVSAQVNDVGPDGRTVPVTGRHLHVSHRHGDTDPEPLTPGEECTVRIQLPARSHVFEAGHRVRLAIATARFPRTFPPRENGTLTIISDPDAPSTLVFPGREHPETVAFDDVVDMAPPDDGFPITARTTTTDQDATATYDAVGRSARYETTQHRTIDLPHGPPGAELSSVRTTAAEVRATDPESARVRTDVEYVLDYGYERIEASTSCRVSHDAAYVATTVTVDGIPIFDERWEH